ncbi:hypothetical protein J2Y73_005451 [Peribacillus frigoritolerans]|uniref:hypothetical protein n=1 Tax=Peribacillus frigoritolerans TaxID=450367 RepID=UPI0020A1F406|nr:hypothetical protein [Peribacillus frigoritolerans]MCP1495285.1 hypothetical protein [Peribacillus frigoritolerans]
MGITIAEIISLPDQGTDYMTRYLEFLGGAAMHSESENIKLNWLTDGLRKMASVPKNLLPGKGEVLKMDLVNPVDEDNIHTREFDLVKSLGTQPIYELRIDLREYNWCFRATFFPKIVGDQLYYCFVYPFEKVPGYDDPTNGFRDKTYKVFDEVKFHFSDYARYFEK